MGWLCEDLNVVETDNVWKKFLHKILTYNKIKLNNSSLIFVQIREGHHTECARPLSAVIKKNKPHLGL